MKPAKPAKVIRLRPGLPRPILAGLAYIRRYILKPERYAFSLCCCFDWAFKPKKTNLLESHFLTARFSSTFAAVEIRITFSAKTAN